MEDYGAFIEEFKGDVKWGTVFNSGMVIDVQLLARLMEKFESRIMDRFASTTEKMSAEIFSIQKQMCEMGNSIGELRDKLNDLADKFKEVKKEVSEANEKNDGNFAKLNETIRDQIGKSEARRNFKKDISEANEKNEGIFGKLDMTKRDQIGKIEARRNFKTAVASQLFNGNTPQLSTDAVCESNGKGAGFYKPIEAAQERTDNPEEGDRTKNAMEIMRQVSTGEMLIKDGNEKSFGGSHGGKHPKGRTNAMNYDPEQAHNSKSGSWRVHRDNSERQSRGAVRDALLYSQPPPPLPKPTRTFVAGVRRSHAKGTLEFTNKNLADAPGCTAERGNDDETKMFLDEFIGTDKMLQGSIVESNRQQKEGTSAKESGTSSVQQHSSDIAQKGGFGKGRYNHREHKEGSSAKESGTSGDTAQKGKFGNGRQSKENTKAAATSGFSPSFLYALTRFPNVMSWVPGKYVYLMSDAIGEVGGLSFIGPFSK
ncbi:hypothetical protein DdX_15240 [Ditylenchus destructor]|uniref:Uncharacterized protein n=1 Tax=Ditylenchus destructor TaxID=166010 RepID=A0AAD4R161_9BILA|nr:hypothetical protein DdX_15240 [Ditylenchus destructor]